MDAKQYNTEVFELESSGAPQSFEATPGSQSVVASTLSELEHIIDNCPIIDNHAHPLLKKNPTKIFDAVGLNLLQIFSEANGDSLKDVPDTLVYHRAFRTLQQTFSHRTDEGINDWNDWKKYRDGVDESEFTRECLEGLQTVLIDDGLRYPPLLRAHDINWHDQFLKSPAKRVLRLESLAEDLMQHNLSFDNWCTKFSEEVKAAIHDPNVVAFKSVIAYRAGLEITHLDINEATFVHAARIGYEDTNEEAKISGKFRIDNEAFNCFVIAVFAAEMVKAAENGSWPRCKPLQFHTGFGDSDLNLKNSNPILLQKFIEEFPTLPIVLLHAAYPYTREAGFLASVYDNVYLDFGLVFPLVSQEGQESVVKQVLELTPSTKAMWSTDAASFGERYYLAIQQMRVVLKKIMGEIHAKESVGIPNLSKIVADVLFNTANRLYGLDLKLNIPSPPLESPTLVNISHLSQKRKCSKSLELLKEFLAKNKGIEYIRLNWFDYSAILRTRIVKLNHVIKQLGENQDGSVLGITKASLYLLVNCHLAEGGKPNGEYRLCPDFTSILLHPHKRDGESVLKHASVMCYIQDETQTPIGVCPRGILQRSISRAEQAGLSDFKIGFEIEFCMFKQSDLDGGKLTPISEPHTWSTSRAFHTKALVILEDIDKKLSAAGIEIEQFHSEAARGQYELILSPLPPMLAVDSLLHTREVIQYVCAMHGYRASLIPKPFDDECGSAAHMHMSFKPVEKQWSFFAGVLDQMRAVNALTLGSPMSFDRVVAGCWAGGLWACWGRQNREAPLRLVEEGKAHWEIKCMDGMANPYFALAGVINAGAKGVVNKREIYGETDIDVSSNDSSTILERDRLGITTRMLESMQAGIAALFERDGKTPTEFSIEMGDGFAEQFASVKNAEMSSLFSRGRSDKVWVRKHKDIAWAAQWY
ncbi:hypothetical protein H072_8129 [Dactylellina haptotyla CBS 200.50]|uniref:Glutamine synthetase n=1 Tax=Dactylellina haptotyla (strain CBS 200.50) TaxID=1284197 RepID=S8BSA5_DACHA|nr:hypothetical protein H072_8129 [Dactylellina haptotyla CBS 200.50]